MKAKIIITQMEKTKKGQLGKSYTQRVFELDEGDYVRLERDVKREDVIWPLTEDHGIEDLIIKK